MKTVTSRVLIILFGTLAAVLIGEGITRYFKMSPVMLDFNIIYSHHFVDNPRICYKMKPFFHRGLNSEGFRGDEFILNKEKNLKRIIMLGDSITYGAFVKQNESFSEVLEKMLNKKSGILSSSMLYDVMNFGVGGYNIVSEIEILKAYGLKYKPDIVVLNYFWNDNEMYSFNYWNSLKRKDVALAKKNWIYQYYLSPVQFRWKRLFFRSHLFTFFWASVNNLRESWLEFNNIEYQNYKSDIVSEKISELRKMGEKHNFKILICMHPVLNYDEETPHLNYSKTKKIASELGIPCVDLLEYYKQQSDNPGIFLVKEKDIYHPNAEGHSLVARSLLLELEKMNYIKWGK
jgi:hypothetical protein